MIFFNSQILEEIKAIVEIQTVIESYLPLKRSGSRYLGVCPFHNDSSPSMYVTPSMGIYKCFACGAAGDHFKFVQEYEKVDFKTAVETIAEIASYTLPEKNASPESIAAAENKKSLVEINFTTAQFFNQELHKNPDALKYLTSRGLSQDTIQTFLLGWAPQSWDSLSKHALASGISRSELIKAGLAVEKEGGRNYDKFRGRIMFPISNLSQKIIAFGGRSLDPEEKAKYMNSPETDLYHKSEVLYGLSHVKNDIAKEGTAIFVEGYMDFLQLWQAGIRNVLSVSGTSLTAEHSRILKRYVTKAYLVFDADEAGIKAAERSIPILLKAGIESKVLLLPSGEDPDSFVKNHGAEAFQTKLKSSQSFPDFFWKRWGLHKDSTPEEKARAGAQFKEILSEIQDPIISQGYRKRIAELLSIPENFLHSQSQQNVQQPVTSQTPVPKDEWRILGIILKNGDLCPLAEQALDLYSFQNVEIAEILDLLFLENPEGHETPWPQLFQSCSPHQKASLDLFNPDAFPIGEIAQQEFIQLIIKQELNTCKILLQKMDRSHPDAIHWFQNLIKIRKTLEALWSDSTDNIREIGEVIESFYSVKIELNENKTNINA